MSRHAVAERMEVDGEQEQQAAEGRQRAQASGHRLGRIARGTAKQDAQGDTKQGQQRQRRHQPDQVGQHTQYRVHALPPSTIAGASASRSPANQSAERPTSGSTALPAHGSQPRRGQ